MNKQKEGIKRSCLKAEEEVGERKRKKNENFMSAKEGNK